MAASHQRGHSVTKVKLFHITPYSYTQSWVKSPGESIDNISADRIDPAEMRRLGDPNRCDQASGPEKLTFKVAANGVSDASVASAMAVEDTPESAQLLKDYKAIRQAGEAARLSRDVGRGRVQDPLGQRDCNWKCVAGQSRAKPGYVCLIRKVFRSESIRLPSGTSVLL